MSTPLRCLLVEDSADDALLIARCLRDGGYDLTLRRVETPEDLRASLEEGGWDIVIADYKLPRFAGLQALDLVLASGTGVPFIIVSGAIGEERAVEAMKAGAHDYVMKDRLARLAPAVRRELRDAITRRERLQAEGERNRLLAELQEANARTKTLSGLLTICAACKKIRDDRNAWRPIEAYIQSRSEARFSHGLCPDCVRTLYPSLQSPPASGSGHGP